MLAGLLVSLSMQPYQPTNQPTNQPTDVCIVWCTVQYSKRAICMVLLYWFVHSGTQNTQTRIWVQYCTLSKNWYRHIQILPNDHAWVPKSTFVRLKNFSYKILHKCTGKKRTKERQHTDKKIWRNTVRIGVFYLCGECKEQSPQSRLKLHWYLPFMQVSRNY